MNWYTGNQIYDTVLTGAFVLVGLTIIGTMFFKTPYGRFGSDRYGLKVSPRLGWFLMELPATISFIFFFFMGKNALETVPLVFIFVWIIHYGNRGFLFPYLIRIAPGNKQTFNLAVVLSGWLVTSVHGYLSASFITNYGTHFVMEWLTDPRFIIGIIIYYSGFTLNIHSDYILRNLRPKDGVIQSSVQRYKIPYGGAFRFVSNPHYLGELIAWGGFALCTWSLAGVFIFAISATNLIPRARDNHTWYLDKFEEYPKERKALVPFIF